MLISFRLKAFNYNLGKKIRKIRHTLNKLSKSTHSSNIFKIDFAKTRNWSNMIWIVQLIEKEKIKEEVIKR